VAANDINGFFMYCNGENNMAKTNGSIEMANRSNRYENENNGNNNGVASIVIGWRVKSAI